VKEVEEAEEVKEPEHLAVYCEGFSFTSLTSFISFTSFYFVSTA